MLAPFIAALFLSFISFFNLLGIAPSLLNNQVSFLVISVLVFIVVKKTGWFFFKNNSQLFYWAGVGLLILTFIIGVEIKGSKRWIDLYFFNFQTSEFLKVAFIAYAAHYFATTRRFAEQASVYLKSLVYFAIPAFIVLIQPDLGNATVFVFVYFVMVLFSNTPKKFILYTVIAVILLAPLGYASLKDYQRARITSFINKSEDQHGASYNMTQAVITTGSGKIAGRGLGYGTQANLFYLPENHTDFAFSSLVEQFGFIGGMTAISLYVLIILSILKRGVKYASADDEEKNYLFLFTIGFVSYFTFQTFVNIAMNMGLLPIVGIALPFISYGGSALVTLAIGLALLP